MSTRVLVTGASGFIGRRLVARLRHDGCAVRALVLPDDAAPGLDGVEIARGDITDAASVHAAMRGVRRVYHLAARVGDWGAASLFQRVNVDGTRNVLEAAAAADCERVLMVSSIVVYGWQLRTGPCDESAPRQRGAGPYSQTKRAAEELALEYHAAGRVPVTVVRPGNVFGPGAHIWVGEVLARIRAGQGAFIDGGHGDAALAYVDNVVDVMARAASAPAAAGRIYNALDGSGVTWRQYMSELARIAGARPPSRSMPLFAARGLAVALERSYRLLRRPTRPLLTPEAVILLASRQAVPIDRAMSELGYQPIAHGDALARVADSLQGDVV